MEKSDIIIMSSAATYHMQLFKKAKVESVIYILTSLADCIAKFQWLYSLNLGTEVSKVCKCIDTSVHILMWLWRFLCGNIL